MTNNGSSDLNRSISYQSRQQKPVQSMRVPVESTANQLNNSVSYNKPSINPQNTQVPPPNVNYLPQNRPTQPTFSSPRQQSITQVQPQQSVMIPTQMQASKQNSQSLSINFGKNNQFNTQVDSSYRPSIQPLKPPTINTNTYQLGNNYSNKSLQSPQTFVSFKDFISHSQHQP